MDQLSSGDVRAATDLALNVLDSGVALEDVVTRLLVPAQLEVGRRWQTSSWSVAEEHVATSVIDAVLAAATFRAGRTPEPRPGRHPVLVVCPEGEWHQLPSRMFAALLAEAGIPVVQLGPSLPARDLHRVLAGHPYDAVVLSCTLLTSLTAGARIITAAHDNGVPVLAGGHSLGADGRRAWALGADAWADSAETAAGVLEGWWGSPPVLASPGVVVLDEPLASALVPQALHRVVDRLRDRVPRLVPETPGALAATYEAVDDPGLLLEFSQWLVSVLVSHAVPAEAVPAAYEELEQALGTRHPRAAGLLRETRHALAEHRVDS
jgi:methanogenic corrinoid protein MtbC1